MNKISKWKRHLKIATRSKNSRIFIASIFVGLFIVCSFTFESISSYNTEIKKAEIQTSNLSQVLEGQIAGSFKSVDLVLQDLQFFYNDNTINKSNLTFSNDFLQDHRKRLPEVLSFKVYDEDGELISDDSGKIAKINLRDREYFQDMKNNPSNRLVISKPIISKTANIWIIVLARPLLDHFGKFRGIIIATIPIDYFIKMLSTINVGNEGMIGLFGTDQYLYVRKPLPLHIVGKQHHMPSILLDFIKKSPDYYKSYRAPSRVDGVDRLVTVRKMANYPFVVIVGLSANEVFMNWKVKAAIHFLIVSLVLGMFAYFLVNYFYSMEQIEEQRKQAIQSAKLSSLGEMAGGIAHEINNPLTIIGTHAKNLKRANTTNDPKINESLDKIITTTNRIAKIIKGLRSFSRDSFNDPYAPTSLSKIVSGTLELCHEKLKMNSIILKVNIPEDLEANCQEIQIAQVLMNLISNSVDAIELLDEKWIEINAYDINNRITLVVTDSGNKIPDDISEKIMLPFFTTKEVGKGTGLGLSISKGIVESHHGKFYLDKKAKHTTFVIELPKAVHAKAA